MRVFDDPSHSTRRRGPAVIPNPGSPQDVVGCGAPLNVQRHPSTVSWGRVVNGQFGDQQRRLDHFEEQGVRTSIAIGDPHRHRARRQVIRVRFGPYHIHRHRSTGDLHFCFATLPKTGRMLQRVGRLQGQRRRHHHGISDGTILIKHPNPRVNAFREGQAVPCGGQGVPVQQGVIRIGGGPLGRPHVPVTRGWHG